MRDDGRSLAGQATAAEPKVSPLRDGIPSADNLTASAFIYAMANVFQSRHAGPLTRDAAIAEAVAALEMVEQLGDTFGCPDFDWSSSGAEDDEYLLEMAYARVSDDLEEEAAAEADWRYQEYRDRLLMERWERDDG